MEEFLHGTISRYMKGKKVFGSTKHVLTKEKSCFTNLATFYNNVTSLVDEGRTVDVIYLNYSKAFTTSVVKHSLP